MPPTQSSWSSAMYDARSASYDDSWHPAFAAHLVSLVSPSPGMHVLDLAAGTGLASYAAAEAVAPSGSVVGVDVSVGMLAQAEGKKADFMQHMRTKHGHALNDGLVRFYEGDITKLVTLPALKGREGGFDAITVASALVLLSDASSALQAWTPYLKPGGILVLDVPHEHNQRHLAIMEIAARAIGLELAFHRSWVTGRDAFVKLVESCNLKVQSIEFVEQTGSGRRYFTIEEGLAMFSTALGPFDVKNENEKKMLKDAYEREWRQAAEREGGTVEDVDGVYVAVVTAGLMP